MHTTMKYFSSMLKILFCEKKCFLKLHQKKERKKKKKKKRTPFLLWYNAYTIGEECQTLYRCLC